MKHILIDGVECMTLPDVANLAGTTIEALRQRQKRGRLNLSPHVTIGNQHFYAASAVRDAMRRGLSR